MDLIFLCIHPNCDKISKYICQADKAITYCSEHKQYHKNHCNSQLINLKNYDTSKIQSSITDLSQILPTPISIDQINEIHDEILQNLSNFTKNLSSHLISSLSSCKTKQDQKWKFQILTYLQLFTKKILEDYIPDLPEFKKIDSFQVFSFNSKLFEGTFDEKITGYGLVQEEGNVYMGSIVEGRYEGRGFMFYENGDKYHGDWECGLKKGFGSWTSKDKSQFKGNFDEGKPNGIGTMIYSNGDKYEGNFSQGVRNGKGTYFYKKSNYDDFDQGNWVNGKLSGNALLVRGGSRHEKKLN
jgi:hypothetical protein